MEHTDWMRELERRGVIASAIAYAVVALLVVQVGAATFEPLGLPRWTVTALIGVALAGLPLVVAAAWFLDLVPDERPFSPPLLADLARRGVFQVLAGFGAAAWLAIQAAESMFPYLGLPDWTIQAVIVGAVLGFPIAGFLAWRFEVTRDAVGAASPRLRGSSPWIALSAGLLVSFASASTWGALIVPPFEERPGFAVLDFVGSEGADGAMLSASMRGVLLDELARFERLKLITADPDRARSTAPADLATIGNELGARYLLTGTVRRVAEQLHVTVSLFDVDHAREVWSRAYARPYADLLALQQSIAFDVARNAAIHVSGTERSAGRAPSSISSEALAAYLEGLDYIHYRRAPPDRGPGRRYRASITSLERAVAIAPEFASAWAWLAMSNAVGAGSAFMPVDRHAARAQARAALAKVETLGATELPEYHLARYQYLRATAEDDLAPQDAALRAVLAVAPNDPMAQEWLIEALADQGRFADARDAMDRFLVLNPQDFDLRRSAANLALALRDYDRADALLREMGTIRRPFHEEPLYHALVGIHRDGDLIGYRDAMDRFLASGRKPYQLTVYYGYWTHSALGDPQRTLEYLETLGADTVAEGGYDSLLAEVHLELGDHARFRRLIGSHPTADDCLRNDRGLRPSRHYTVATNCVQTMVLWGDLDAAHDALERIQAAIPPDSAVRDWVHARYWVALVFGMLGDHVRATELMRDALRFPSADISPWFAWSTREARTLRDYPPFREMMRSHGVDVDRPFGQGPG
jgi:TolB-like protein/tetratricopeptide (TPR) repeat protein